MTRSAMYSVVVGVLGVALACTGVVAASAAVEIDSRLPSYERVEGVSGTIKSMGSDTMLNVMTHWAEGYRRHYPSVTIEIEGKGSSSAPPALIEGQSQFGPMSRAMKPSEEEAFEKAYGYKPTLLRPGIDCLAVFVHNDCPLDEITIEQLEMVFSTEGSEMKWGDLGVTDTRFRDKPISLYGRNSASGTYAFFKKVALGEHDYKSSVKEQPGSAGVVQAVATDVYAMGYSGIGYRTANVKALRVGGYGAPAVEPSAETAYSGEYPLARYLYVYVNHDPTRTIDPVREQFIRYMFSRDGQEGILKDGYFPVSAEIAREDLESVGLEASF